MTYSDVALGQVIQKHRTARELTQEQLGKRAEYQAGAGVSISRVENGSTRVGPDRLAKIANALGVTPHALKAEAAELTEQLAAAPSRRPETETLEERARRITAEVDRRTTTVKELAEA